MIAAHRIFPTASARIRVAARRSAQTTLGLDKALSMIVRGVEAGEDFAGCHTRNFGALDKDNAGTERGRQGRPFE